MSSVEESQREDDSLSEELELLLKNNNIQKNRSTSRNSKNINSQDSLYKQALKQYMFGNFQMASESCKKMIANNPENSEPYFLMATMHQQAAKRNNDNNQLHKSVQYFFFHAYYSTPSLDKWIKVATMSYDLEFYMQAAYCYGRALKINKSNLQISLKRAECLQLCFQIKKAVSIYKRIIQKISNSVDVYKRYAKLRFRRQQYSKARQILLSYPNFQNDINIKFMSAETYLKQKKFPQLYTFISQHIIQSSNPPISNIFQQLQLQFIQMLFICRVNCPNQTPANLKIQDMLEYLKIQYEEQQSSLYQEIILYIKKDNPEITFQLLVFLLKYDAHQTIENYLYLSQFLMKAKKYSDALKILEEGLKTPKNKNSVQLKTQFNYLKTFDKNHVTHVKINKKQIYNNSIKEQQIFYSDQEPKKQQQDQSNHINKLNDESNPKNQSSNFAENHKTRQKIKRIKKTKTHQNNSIFGHLEVKDPQILGKLIQNNYTTLDSLQKELTILIDANQIANAQQFITNKFNQVKDCLKYLIEIQGTNRQGSPTLLFKSSHAKHSIFHNKQQKKRRMGFGGKSSRLNLITNNSSNLIQSLKCVIWFMRQYLKQQKYSQVVELAQLLSKAHFFKWQNRIQDFKLLKKQVYEIGMLACLELNKYGKSIFFLRYLINKNPSNQFYLLVAEKIMRLSADKLFMNSMVKKGIDWDTQTKNGYLQDKNLIKMYYLTGLQYMQNCFFQLAINMFTKVLIIIEQEIAEPSKQYQQINKNIYLCMSTCFLQLASSRTVFNKLDHVNRSIFCLAKYKNNNSQTDQLLVMYNKGRWYSYIKMYHKAILAYQLILQSKTSEALIQRTALNLMIIYKDLQNYEKVQELSEKYFHHRV